MQITDSKKRHLRAQAHKLKPVVLLGQHGLTDAVGAEIERALYDHELIKLKLPACPREQRQVLTSEICEQQKAALIQSIGRTIVLYRPSDKNKK